MWVECEQRARDVKVAGCVSPSQWPSMIVSPFQLLVISTSPPHTQVALTRAVKAAHTKRVEPMVVG